MGSLASRHVDSPPPWPPTQKISQRRFTSKGASGQFEMQAPSLEGGSPSPAPLFSAKCTGLPAHPQVATSHLVGWAH